ncbi:MAG: selenium metabolism-associated LysR family transcriptional regulator [Filifactor alocis]|nr:selenium metabolism-associated LysR family transcriptional regulator [Filifactor alocis]
MEFKELEVFVALVELKSFSKAAKALNLSQPTVSIHIKNLEEELDTVLFVRSTRDMKITDEALLLYKEAKELILKKNQMMEYFTRLRRKEVVVGVSTISATYLLPHLMGNFYKKNPDISIKVEEKNSRDTINSIADKRVDIGIVGMKTEEENCCFFPIYKDEFVFVAPNTPYYRDLKESDPSIQTLAKEPFIVRESGSGVKKHMEMIMKSCGVKIQDINIVASINDVEVMKRLVVEGIGVSFLSKIAVKNLVEEGKLVEIPLGNAEQRYRHLYLVWNDKMNMPSYIKEFLNFIKDRYHTEEAEEGR